jgi:spore coat polysaccharide biosynthesis predicted glycosyltransferase SpsG
MRVLLHADGGSGVGLGHASRCAALANALGRAGHAAFIAVAPASGLEAYLEGLGARAIPASGEADAIQALAGNLGAEVLVIDSYRWREGDFLRLKDIRKRIAFDDIADRALPVDAIINGAAAADRLNYRVMPHTRLWLGSTYQVVKDAFREDVQRPLAGVLRNLIVLVGGDDPLNLLSPLASRLHVLTTEALPNLQVHLICGPYTPAPDCSALPGVHVLRHPGDLRERMASADLALSAGGQTLYELARCGVPTIAFRSGEDQAHNLATLATTGAIVDSGDARIEGWMDHMTEVCLHLAARPQERQRLSVAARQVIDGRGADRLVVKLENLVHGED